MIVTEIMKRERRTQYSDFSSNSRELGRPQVDNIVRHLPGRPYMRPWYTSRPLGQP